MQKKSIWDIKIIFITFDFFYARFDRAPWNWENGLDQKIMRLELEDFYADKSPQLAGTKFRIFEKKIYTTLISHIIASLKNPITNLGNLQICFSMSLGYFTFYVLV